MTTPGDVTSSTADDFAADLAAAHARLAPRLDAASDDKLSALDFALLDSWVPGFADEEWVDNAAKAAGI